MCEIHVCPCSNCIFSHKIQNSAATVLSPPCLHLLIEHYGLIPRGDWTNNLFSLKQCALVYSPTAALTQTSERKGKEHLKGKNLQLLVRGCPFVHSFWLKLLLCCSYPVTSPLLFTLVCLKPHIHKTYTLCIVEVYVGHWSIQCSLPFFDTNLNQYPLESLYICPYIGRTS